MPTALSALSRPSSSGARLLPLVALIGAALVTPSLLRAQSPMPMPATGPTISTTGLGSVAVAPDRAEIVFAVETRAATASAAARQNATLQQRVIAALRAAGVAERDLTTTGYSVNPDYRYDQTSQEQRVVGYIARNGVQVMVRDIDRVGALIDAAIEAGANSVGSLNFLSSRVAEVRREALQRAVQRACEDAEVMARAAGGTLGGLMELSSQDIRMPPPRPMGAMMRDQAQEASTPIQQGELVVEAVVSARYSFVAGGPGRSCG